MAGILGVQKVANHDRYLGLPTYLGCQKIDALPFLKHKLAPKLNGWKGKILSGGGIEILVKVAAQALSVYSMNVLFIPKKLCNVLNSMVARFWWSGDSEKRKIH